MSNHRVTIAGEPNGICQARCTCLAKSQVGSRGDVEEWIFKHNELVERVKAQLGSRTPAMKSTLAWFRMQEVNTDNPAEDRVLWKKLADEMESFTAARQVRTTSLQQPQLW